MALLHMETELVRETGRQLGKMSVFLTQNYQQLLQSTQSLSGNWQGSSRDFFIGEINPLLNQISHLADAGNTLNQRVQREVDEWERVGQGIDLITGNLRIGTPELSPGDVLGAIDSTQQSENEATIVEWVEGVYETIELFISKVAPGNKITEWMGGVGTFLKGLDVISSTQEVTETGEVWRQTMSQYGTDAPETLAARYEYSDAEVSQIIPGPIELALKQFGVWDELVRSFEGAKYEGTHNLFDPPKVQ